MNCVINSHSSAHGTLSTHKDVAWQHFIYKATECKFFFHCLSRVPRTQFKHCSWA